MQPPQIHTITKPIKITVTGKKISLPDSLQKKVDKHWAQLVAKNPRLYNGESFTVTSTQETAASIRMELAETDYAHYLYNNQIGGLQEYAIQTVYPAAFIVTADNKIAFGEMSLHTSSPGIIQCCGGGIDYQHVQDGVVDLNQNMANELQEEMGIDPYNKDQVSSFFLSHLQTDGPGGKMTVLYTLYLKQTSDEFLHAYSNFVKELAAKGEDPEFSKIYCIDTDQKTIEQFITQHADNLNVLMPTLLRGFITNLRRGA